MSYQLSSLKRRGQSCAVIASVGNRVEDEDSDKLCFEGMPEPDVRAGLAEIVFAHPEVFVSSRKCRDLLLSGVYQDNVVCVVADEADHCIVDW